MTLHSLFAADEFGNRWTRSGAFLLAYAIAQVASQSFEAFIRFDPSDTAVRVAVFRPWWLIRTVLISALLVGISTFVLRRVRQPVVASAAIAFVYMLVTAPLFELHKLYGVDDAQLLRQLIAVRLAWPFVFLIGVHTALRLIRLTPVALFTGALAALLIQQAIFQIWFLLTTANAALDIKRVLSSLPFEAVWAVVFAEVLWVTLRALDVRPSRLAVVPMLAWVLGSGTLAMAMTATAMTFGGVSLGGLFAAAIALLLIGAIGFLMVVHRAWGSLPATERRMTPGAAIGRLLIPGYNLYWAFQVFGGFATDYNSWLGKHGSMHRRLPVAVFIGYVVLSLAGVIPRIGFYVAIVQLLVGAYVIAEMSRAANVAGSLAADRRPPDANFLLC